MKSGLTATLTKHKFFNLIKGIISKLKIQKLYKCKKKLIKLKKTLNKIIIKRKILKI